MFEDVRHDAKHFVVNVTVLTDSAKCQEQSQKTLLQRVLCRRGRHVRGRRAILGSGAHRSL